MSDSDRSARLRKIMEDVFNFAALYEDAYPGPVQISTMLRNFDSNVAATEGYTGIDMLYAGMFFTQLPGFQDQLTNIKKENEA